MIFDWSTVASLFSSTTAAHNSMASSYWVPHTVIGIMICNGLVDNVLSDYLWAKAVLYTTPTVATVGLSITIPMALLTDFWLHGTIPSLFAVIGSLLVIVGFCVINYASEGEASEADTTVTNNNEARTS